MLRSCQVPTLSECPAYLRTNNRKFTMSIIPSASPTWRSIVVIQFYKVLVDQILNHEFTAKHLFLAYPYFYATSYYGKLSPRGDR